MVFLRWKIVAAMVALAVSAAIPAAADEASLPKGIVVPSVAALDDASQTYALYLPSAYTKDRRWPIIYAFDPFAHGKTPVELYKDVAEKYGYILAASNVARNGPAAPAMAAAQSVWHDTHRRLALDRDRVYTTGLSGGARFATSFALYCYTCAIAGVIAQGAGYPAGKIEGGKDGFLYYMAVGDADFNLPELLQLRRKKEERGQPYRIKIYPGPHQWAPAAIFEDAIEWLEVKAMQAGTEKTDRAFITRIFDRTREEAVRAEQQSDALARLSALRSLVSDFKGFDGMDLAEFEAELAVLKSSKALKGALRKEQREIERQESLTRKAGGQLGALAAADGQEQIMLRQELDAAFSGLRRCIGSNGPDRTLCLRALNQLWVQGMESGEEEMRQGHLMQATVYFELMANVAPQSSWPVLRLAAARVKAGNHKAALKALEESVKRGVKNPDTLTQDPDLQPLASEPEFQKLVEELRTKR